jgi:FlaA1/EpsC-like NDP-sugar epimerase
MGDDVTSGQKALLWRILRNFRLRIRTPKGSRDIRSLPVAMSVMRNDTICTTILVRHSQKSWDNIFFIYINFISVFQIWLNVYLLTSYMTRFGLWIFMSKITHDFWLCLTRIVVQIVSLRMTDMATGSDRLSRVAMLLIGRGRPKERPQFPGEALWVMTSLPVKRPYYGGYCATSGCAYAHQRGHVTFGHYR